MSSDATALDMPATSSSQTAAEHLEVLWVAHRDAVFRYVRAICRDEDTALDLTAATFERAFAALRAGKEPGIGWLLRTARNAAIDAERRARVAWVFRRRYDPTDAVARSLESSAVALEQDRLVCEAVRQLPRAQRDAIVLRYTTDLTVREIASVIGKSPAAAQKLLDRGLVRLKETLHDLG